MLVLPQRVKGLVLPVSLALAEYKHRLRVRLIISFQDLQRERSLSTKVLEIDRLISQKKKKEDEELL